MTDLKTICLDVAQTIADRAKEKDIPFAEATDALKALTALYVATRKHPDDDEEGDAGFDFSKGVQSPAPQDQPNGAAARVHPSRRRPSSAPARDA